MRCVLQPLIDKFVCVIQYKWKAYRQHWQDSPRPPATTKCPDRNVAAKSARLFSIGAAVVHVSVH